MKKYIAAFYAIIIVILISLGCKQNSPINYAGKFVGVWTGINSCDSSTEIDTITTGLDGTSVYSSGYIGYDSCFKEINIYGAALGDSMKFMATIFTDNCGNGYTIKENGTIIDTTLVITRTTSGTINTTCTITANK